MKEGRVLSPEEIVAIFKRFPEGNPYYIPLFLAYAYGMDKDEAFAITVNDVRDASYIITTRKVKYNRSNNQHYISKARVIHGKKGKFEYVDPEWKFEDMITSGYFYRHKIFA